jgi:hypothetical protein
MRSESRCALRLRYVGLVVSTEVAVEVCCFFNVFSYYDSGCSAIPVMCVIV